MSSVIAERRVSKSVRDKKPKIGVPIKVGKYPRVRITEDEAAELFDGHRALAKRLAGNYAAKFPKVAYDDLVDVAESTMAETIANWSHPDRGWNYTKTNPTSWLYREIYYGLLTFCTRQQPRELTFTDVTPEPKAGRDSKATVFRRRENWFESLLRTLGEDARVVASTLTAAPAELAKEFRPGPKFGGRVKEGLKLQLSNLGWPPARFDRAWDELAAAV